MASSLLDHGLVMSVFLYQMPQVLPSLHGSSHPQEFLESSLLLTILAPGMIAAPTLGDPGVFQQPFLASFDPAHAF